MADEHKQTGIQPGETTIAAKLKQSGYQTALIGKWHLGHGDKSLLPTRHGFDKFIGHTGGCIDFFTMTYGDIPDWYHQERHVPEDGYATDLITDEAVNYLTDRQTKDQPFFLYLAYNAPHFGKGYSPKDKAPVNLMQPKADAIKRVSFIEDKIRREFAAMTVSLDDGIGRVMGALKRLDLERETLVVFLTDHGGDPTYGGSNLPLRGDKATLFEGGIQVPCIMRWPGRIEAGTESHALLWSIDLFPTFCSLAGIRTNDAKIDGKDISPVLFEKADWQDRTLFWELGAHAELERKPWSAVRSGKWKYLQTPSSGEFLFNLEDDPNEATDLSGSNQAQFRRMRTLRDQLSIAVRQ
jgi:arylsulfatase A-like enzyme